MKVSLDITHKDFGIWDIIFSNDVLSIWSCFYCINEEDDKDVRNLIIYPSHALFYSLETENYGGMLNIIKDDIKTLFLYSKIIYNDEEIEEMLNENKDYLKDKFPMGIVKFVIEVCNEEINYCTLFDSKNGFQL